MLLLLADQHTPFGDSFTGSLISLESLEKQIRTEATGCQNKCSQAGALQGRICFPFHTWILSPDLHLGGGGVIQNIHFHTHSTTPPPIHTLHYLKEDWQWMFKLVCRKEKILKRWGKSMSGNPPHVSGLNKWVLERCGTSPPTPKKESKENTLIGPWLPY